MEMTPTSYRQFWIDAARAVPHDFALVHYNTRRLPNYQSGADYAALCEVVPNLVGAKQITGDASEFRSFVESAPRLAHFTLDQFLAPLVRVGARGVNSWFANFNAPYVVALYQDCLAQNWTSALQRQERLNRFDTIRREVLGPYGSHGIMNKGVAAASPFLVGAPRTRRPYLPIPGHVIEEFQRCVAEELPDLL